MNTILSGETVIKAVQFFAAVGFIVTLWAGFRLTVALIDLYDWWERGHNPFGLSIDECIRTRVAAGTLAPDGKRWTADTLKSKEAREASLEAERFPERRVVAET